LTYLHAGLPDEARMKAPVPPEQHSAFLPGTDRPVRDHRVGAANTAALAVSAGIWVLFIGALALISPTVAASLFGSDSPADELVAGFVLVIIAAVSVGVFTARIARRVIPNRYTRERGVTLAWLAVAVPSVAIAALADHSTSTFSLVVSVAAVMALVSAALIAQQTPANEAASAMAAHTAANA
jgi:hypothetical protein